MPQNACTEGFWSDKTKVDKKEGWRYQLAATYLPQSNDLHVIANSNDLYSSNNCAKDLALLTTYSSWQWLSQRSK